MSLTLHPRKLAGEEIQRLLTILLADAEHALGIFASDPATAIHSIRTAMKKTRAVLGLARNELPGDPVTKCLNLARDIKNFHADTREEEVLRRLCLQLCRTDDEVALVEKWFGQGDPAAGTADPALRAQLAELRTCLQQLPYWVITPKGIRTAYARTATRLRKGRKQSKKGGSNEDFHEWRKQVKDFWMQSCALRKMLGLPDRIREQTRKLGEILGEANDLANLGERLRQIKGPEIGAASSLLDRAEKRLLATRQRALDQGKKLQSLLP